MRLTYFPPSPRQNCHLDRRTLSICISMIENGVNPEALAVCYSHRPPPPFATRPPFSLFFNPNNIRFLQNVVQFMRKELQKSQFAANDASRGNEGRGGGSAAAPAPDWK